MGLVNKSASVRVKCPNCGKQTESTLRRLENNPPCPGCGVAFEGKKYLGFLEQQMAAAAEDMRRQLSRASKRLR
jgi:predicted RNA-binding Zn-ribbon protein involved in translation (DUF1610 family)